MPYSHGHASDLPEAPRIRVHFAAPEDLRLIPGVGAQLANTTVMLRKSRDNLNPDLLGGGRVVRLGWVNFQCRGVLQF